jgi:hypothetical protein
VPSVLAVAALVALLLHIAADAGAQTHSTPPIAGRLPDGVKIVLADGPFNPDIALPPPKGTAFGRGANACARFWLQGNHYSAEGLIGALVLALVSAPLCGAANTVHTEIQVAETAKAGKIILPLVDKRPAWRSAPLMEMQAHARNMGMGEIAVLHAKELDALNSARNAPYVFQVATGVQLAPDAGPSEVPRYRLILVVQGVLSHASSNAILDVYAAQHETGPRSVDEWIAEDGKVLGEEIERARQRMAEALVDRWLAHKMPCALQARELAEGIKLALSPAGEGANALVQAVIRSGQATTSVPVLVRADDFSALADRLQSVPPAELPGLLPNAGTPTAGQQSSVEFICIISAEGHAIELSPAPACHSPWSRRSFPAQGIFRDDAVRVVNKQDGYSGSYICALEKNGDWTDETRDGVLRFLKSIPERVGEATTASATKVDRTQ